MSSLTTVPKGGAQDLWDKILSFCSVHPSVALVPAILAEAEAIDASGEQMVLAYAVGYETGAELMRRDPDHQHKKGWHPTGIFGAIAAAAACASLRRLNAEKAAHAIALGASQSAGLTANFGTMAKPFHAGRAAHAGVASARLAARGFTTSFDALEHPLGFLQAVSLAGRIDVDSHLLPIMVKSFANPVVMARHRAIERPHHSRILGE